RSPSPASRRWWPGIPTRRPITTRPRGPTARERSKVNCRSTATRAAPARGCAGTAFSSASSPPPWTMPCSTPWCARNWPGPASTDLSLGAVDPARRVVECGFFLAAEALDRDWLIDVLARHGGLRARDYVDAVERTVLESLDGFMRGFIDLVFEHRGRFYLADYKSNDVGPDDGWYRREHLKDAMWANRYHLQYLLYTVAVDRYLAARHAGYDYDAHFGGVYYLFLRGMGRHAGRGVFFDRPSAAL